MKFKVGDKVKILFVAKNDPSDMHLNVGKIGIVKTINNEYKFYNVSVKDDIYWSYSEKMLEKVEPEKK